MKSINKKVVKPDKNGGQLKKGVVSQKDDNCTLRATGRKGKKQSLESAITDNEDDILDSTNVFQQFHKEVSDFKTKYIGGTSMNSTNSKCEGLNSVSKDSSNGVSNNFDVVASDLIDRNHLVDQGFIGSKFTWMTKRGIGEEIWVRLDIALCSMDLRIRFNEGFVRHFPRMISNHCLILLQLHSSQIPDRKFKPFRVEAMWMKHDGFEEKSKNCWLKDGDKNTKCFHLSTVIRRSINKLEGIKRDDGSWASFPTSRVFYTSNIIISKAKSYAETCGSHLTNNLENYLGAPLIHASRITLIKSMATSLPVYAMQSIKLPKEICSNLDEINKDILWGHTTDKRKMHLVNWETFCLPKAKEGRGIKQMKKMNQALLAKASWRLMQNENGLWDSILKAKYIKDDNIGKDEISFINNCSSTLSGFSFGAELTSKGLKWIVGDGCQILFWSDVWVPEFDSLMCHATVPLSVDQLHEKVSDYIYDEE
ncbi:hypothetical protein Ddye_002994 [Dipteronia dyeriana]|uniref:Uncharacterized protein n=1 Tax=Dipteronia dyeriana TaxID=168575 RepID=A0AAE0CUW1_9ROSI|nr:hypothetical protein Ddye_002994 [Dipteronia dyeriana]